jgi:hypothetical protein
MQEAEPSLLAYMVQQIGVPIGSLLVVVFIGATLSPLFRIVGSSNFAEVPLGYAAALIVGSIFGFTASHLIPSIRSSGRWVWILPTSLFALVFFSECFTFSLKRAFRECFFPGQNGEEAIGFLLMTCPTLSTVCYSV